MRYTIYAPDTTDTHYRMLIDGKLWIPFDKIEIDGSEFILYCDKRLVAAIEPNFEDSFNMFNYEGF